MLAYADDNSLYADILSPATRQIVADSITADLMIMLSWYSRWGMELYPTNSKDMIVSRSRTQMSQHLSAD